MARRESIDVGYPGTHVRYLSVYNDSGESAPAGAAMRITRIDGQGIAHVDKPDSNGQTAGIVFNALVSLPANAHGSATQEMPAVAAYTAVDVDGGGNAPSNGEVWGTVAGSWHLSRAGCGNGYYILGGAGDGLVNVTLAENKPRKFRITSRTDVSCGNSGSLAFSGTELSGSNVTDHAIYIYTLHSVRAVNDGDGCPTYIDDDVAEAIIIDEAYEQNGNMVEEGTIVDAKRETYTDESVPSSGSGTNDGPVGCRWIFAHEVTRVVEFDPRELPSYRYYCVDELGNSSDTQTEWLVLPGGIEQFVRHTGVCCDCPHVLSGSEGSGSDGTCCDTPDTFCLTLYDVPIWWIGTEFVFRQDELMTDQWVSGGISNGYDYSSSITKINNADGTCSYWLRSFFNGAQGGGGSTTSWGMWGMASSYTCEPFSMTFDTISVLYNTGNPNAIIDSFEANGTVAAGLCDEATSGSEGQGDCPCQWHYTASWGLAFGDPGVCTTPPAGAGTIGEYRNTNADGTTCTPGEGGDGVNDCADCGPYDDESTAAVTEFGSDGWVANADGKTLTYNTTEEAFYSASFLIGNTSTRLIMWCEGTQWWFTFEDSGSAWPVNGQFDDCTDEMAFNLAYDSSNTLFPGTGSSGTMLVVITA